MHENRFGHVNVLGIKYRQYLIKFDHTTGFRYYIL